MHLTCFQGVVTEANPPPERNPDALLPPDSLEMQVVQVFVDGVRVLGLPRSLGELYGLLFISPAPLALDDLVSRLGISKGSASQGLRALKDLGAVREIDVEGARRTYFEADIDLKRLVGGFIREQIRPHLESGQVKSSRLSSQAATEVDPAKREFYDERLEKLQNWIRRGRRVLPVLQKLLGE
jgi:DNA-binding transcriptional regulator GbsR (MarR family)